MLLLLALFVPPSVGGVFWLPNRGGKKCLSRNTVKGSHLWLGRMDSEDELLTHKNRVRNPPMENPVSEIKESAFKLNGEDHGDMNFDAEVGIISVHCK